MHRFPALLACILSAVLIASPASASWDDGVSAFRAGRWDEAAAAFEAFLARSPQAADAHYMLGLSRLQQRRGVEALASLARAVELGEGQARFSLALAQAQTRTGDGDAALSTLAALDPAALAPAERKSFNQLLARAADLGQDNTAAEASLRRALDVDGKVKELWLALANVSGRLDRPEERFSALARAFEIDPADHEPGRLATEVAIRIAQDEADAERRREWYRRASRVGARLAASSPTAEHLMLAGSAAMGAQDYAAAVASFERVVAAGGDDLRVHLYLGRSTLAAGRHEEALDHLQTALERSPSAERAREIHAARGLAYRSLERFDLAAEAYRQAGDAASAAEMAGYHENRREWAAARADCQRKRAQIEEMRKDPGLLEGTAEWDELERQMNQILAGCEPYLLEVTG